MSGEKYGQVIELLWEGEPPWEVIKGHTGSIEAINEACRSTGLDKSAFGRVKHRYAGYRMDGSVEYDYVMRIYMKPDRGRFPVTLVEYKREDVCR